MTKAVVALPPRGLRGLKATVLAVRDMVQFPGVIHSLLVGREMSVNAVRQATRKGRHLVVVAQRETSTESPRGQDLYNVGTLCEVLDRKSVV